MMHPPPDEHLKPEPLSIPPLKTKSEARKPWVASGGSLFKQWTFNGASSVMLSCLVLGLLSAVGHHVFNRHWNGVDVQTASWSQDWVNRAGTSFAFLTKMFLGIATATAYTQCFWLTAQNQPLEIERLDSMFDVLDNALQFFHVSFWLRNPVLVLVAIITW